jgi:hypothetical protein
LCDLVTLILKLFSVDLVAVLNYDAERRINIGELFTKLDLIHVETKQALYAEAITTGSASHLPRVGWGGLGGPDMERELPVRSRLRA